MRDTLRRIVQSMVFAAAAGYGLGAKAGAQKPPVAGSKTAIQAQVQQLRDSGKSREAAAQLKQYLLKHPADADAMATLAQLDLEAGDGEGAHRLLEQAQRLLEQELRADPTSPAANLGAGRMLLNAGEYPQAMDRFETVLLTHPENTDARGMEMQAATKLAAQAQAAGHPEAALEVWEHARLSLPDDPALLLALGMQAFDLHRLPEAAAALQVALKLRPEDPDILYGAARIALDQQQMPTAEQDMRRYLELRPGDASAHFGLGHMYAMEQRSDAARAEFERSIELQPVQTESYYQIGELDLEAQQDAAAEALFQRVIGRDPNHGGALTGLGEIAFHARHYAEAEVYLSRAVKAAPEYGTAHYYRGLVLARLGRAAESDAELQQATQLGHDAGAPAQGGPAVPAQ
jgi:tetratricopeptide (TPR) repeat protein